MDLQVPERRSQNAGLWRLPAGKATNGNRWEFLLRESRGRQRRHYEEGKSHTGESWQDPPAAKYVSKPKHLLSDGISPVTQHVAPKPSLSGLLAIMVMFAKHACMKWKDIHSSLLVLILKLTAAL